MGTTNLALTLSVAVAALIPSGINSALADEQSPSPIVYARYGDGRYPEIHVMSESGEDMARLTRYRAEDFAPVWSPDGRRIAFVRDSDPKPPEVYGGVECGSRKASAYLKRLATGRRVVLRTDPTQDRFDRYDRLLAPANRQA